MHARVTGAKYNGPPYQSVAATGLRETRVTTVSTDALRIGLAHFIHEINNPLQTVYWAADVMDTHMPKANGSGDPFAGKIFQELKGGVDQLVTLVSSLESQLKSLWMIDPCFESVNLNSLIVEIIQNDVARFTAGGIRIDTDIAVALPALQADAKLLSQVFVNLFRNAADAMPEGGVLSVSAGARAAIGVARNRRHRSGYRARLGRFSTVYHIEATRHGPRVSDYPAYRRNPWRDHHLSKRARQGHHFLSEISEQLGNKEDTSSARRRSG